MPTKPPLTEGQILLWADAHCARTGKWPSVTSGRVRESPETTWKAIGRALDAGVRGLPGGCSLARLLEEHRGYRNAGHLPRLTIRQIVRWVDAHRKRTGEWPVATSGPLADVPGETWCAINLALTVGRRGLSGGSSLAKVLAEHRGKRNCQSLPRLSYRQILAWADAHHARTRRWPNVKSGRIKESPDKTWRGIQSALSAGTRGLPGGTTLPQLLERCRGVRNRLNPPRLSLARILKWADAHHKRTGRWPTEHSGPVTGAPGETWAGVGYALLRGQRGLQGGTTLAQFLVRNRGKPKYYLAMGRHSPKKKARLTVRQILAWADKHQRKRKKWPSRISGAVADTPGETWASIDAALRAGSRGLCAGYTLGSLLAEQRGLRSRWSVAPLSIEQVLAWADAHKKRTGRWPRAGDGPVVAAPGESWRAINVALSQGLRGLPAGSSLPGLLAGHRGVRNRKRLPKLTIQQILAWADKHRRRHAEWPQRDSGPVGGVDGETWSAVDYALRTSTRGLPRGFTLAKLLATGIS